jgi:hypothetical protein
MSHLQSNVPDAEEIFLDGAYRRIQRTTIAVNSVAILVALILFGWRAALGGLIGTATAWLNLRWLHLGSETLVESMLASSGRDQQRLRLFFLFVGRLAFMLAVGYVTFKSSLQALYFFLVALGLAVVGLLSEAVYEAWMGRRMD